MKIYFINITKQVVCWILLLQIINISIDPPDFKHTKYSIVTRNEVLSVDETETIYELIAESMSDQKVPESNEDGTDTIAPYVELFFSSTPFIKLHAFGSIIEHFSYYEDIFSLIHEEPLSPPPRIS
jgi:hypothetical protein